MDGCIPNYRNAVWSYYRYEPSLAGAVIFCVLFGISTCLHAFQMYKTRTWYLTALIVGGLAECIGYIARAINATEEPGCWTLGPYVAQTVLILIGPACMAASIYMILGRIIQLTDGDSHSLVRRRWITKIFVTGDVISLLMQASGGGMMAVGEDLLKTGENIIVGGLFVQLAFFGFFVIASGIFHRRMSLQPTASASDPAVRWKRYLTTLYVTSGLILVRSIFRVIEYLNGNDGVLLRSEVYLYVFDSLLMAVVLLWMNWFHPSELGLLLRGQSPGKNGLELVGVRI